VLGEGESQIGLWGGNGSGKTHLLNASADFARRHGVVLQIYDAAQLLHCDPAEFDGYDRCDVLAVDNLDALAGNPGWETFFYRVVNRCRDGDYRFIFAMAERPQGLRTCLDDFRSRLQWGLLLQLPGSGDKEIREILRRRASLLGFELSDEVIAYLMTHYARNLASQMSILQRLDGISLSQQRRVTIPLVKQALLDRPE
jgi:DnaA family protein